ncbi:MAG TPA: flagellar basal body L-ring protein FlgH [Azospirillum sp.]
MSAPIARTALRLALLAAVAASVSACGAAGRLADVGQAPGMSKIQDPLAMPGYQPVSLPMPTPLPAERNPNSLWRTGAKAFFKDQRAAKVGDILTVLIEIDDQAQIDNESKRSRDNGESMGLPNMFGLESRLAAVLPDAVDAESLVSATSKSTNTGKGAIKRKEQIELKVAALVTQTLPNGNLVIQGRQEVRVNFERRDLVMSGVVRPEDITAQNTISYEKIAEARIAYGGHGQITDVQQPRYGQQLFDIISPF